MAMLAGYEAQHNDFVAHQQKQITVLEKQIEIAERPPRMGFIGVLAIFCWKFSI